MSQEATKVVINCYEILTHSYRIPGKYDLKLAEPPTPPESDSDCDSPVDSANKSPKDDFGNSCREVHPTSCLKVASVALLRVILLSCGIEADRVQFSAIKLFSSVIRGIITTANKIENKCLLPREQNESWATLGLLRAVAGTRVMREAFSTPVWVNFLLRLIADDSSDNLRRKILAARLLTVVAPSWNVEGPETAALLEKIFKLLGQIALTCEPDGNVELHSDKCRVSLTASQSSTLSEEMIALVRMLHGLSGWNEALNAFFAEKLALASNLLTENASFQGQVNENAENGLVLQQIVMAALACIGGIDCRPRIGAVVDVEGQIGTVYRWV